MVSFRDETHALRERVEQLERDAAAARRERDAAVEERDAARREADESEAEREARLVRTTTFPVGTPVFVEWRGTWWDATVLEVRSSQSWRIRYDGWGSRWDEDVNATRIVARSPAPPGPRPSGGAGGVIVGALLLLAMAALAFYWLVD